MIKYCDDYWHADKSTYKYHSDIFTRPIKEYKRMFLEKENIKLKTEIKEINKNLYELIEKTNYSIEELDKIIKICQNKIN